MAQQLIPYSFQGIPSYPRSQPAQTLPGQAQGVYFTLPLDVHADLLAVISGWFEGRDEVVLVDAGTTDKQGLGFLIIEWMECDIDDLFLAILRDEELVEDYTVYGRTWEV